MNRQAIVCRNALIAITVLACLALPPDPCGAQSREEDLRLVEDICLMCHGMDGGMFYPRSEKSWELTVYRMQGYAQDQDLGFTDAEADRIIAFLATEPPEIFGEPETEEQPEDEPADANDAVAGGEQDRPGRVRRQAAARGAPAGFAPPSRATAIARIAGYASVVFGGLLAVTGMLRRPMKRAFRPVHRGLAIALLVGVALHAAIYLSEYGAPPVSWLWLGLASSVVLGVAELAGATRVPLRKWFIRLHVPAGVAGMGLAVLHWVWAYIF
jgi:hypothetical protein